MLRKLDRHVRHFEPDAIATVQRIEARLDLLRRTVSAAVPPRANCAAVMLSLVGQETVHDDIAIPMMRRAALRRCRAGVTHAPHFRRQQR